MHGVHGFAEQPTNGLLGLCLKTYDWPSVLYQTIYEWPSGLYQTTGGWSSGANKLRMAIWALTDGLLG